MLKKLVKYDLKNIFKVLVVFYALSFFFALLTRAFFAIDNSFIMNIIAKICSGVTISMIFNILINNMMRCWPRFSRNLYGDESYLSHTLPVKKSTHYYSKALASVITLAASTVVIVATLFVAYYSKTNWEILKNFLSVISKAIDENMFMIITAIVAILFLEIANGIQCGFTGIIFGHRMNSNKTAFSILYGFIVYMLSQVIVVLILLIVGLMDEKVMNLFVTAENVPIEMVKKLVLIAALSYSAIIIAGLFINVKLLKKGVNVD